MVNDVKISCTQLFTLITGFMIGTLTIASVLANQDAWLAFLIAWVAGMTLIGVYVGISQLNPSQTFVEILKNYFGQILGGLISILYIWYFLHDGALILRNLSNFMITSIYPKTNIIFMLACVMLVIGYMVRKGLEAMVRISEVLAWLPPVLLFFIFFALVNEYQFTNLFPVLEKGWMPVTKAAFTQLTFPFGEVVIFLMIFPYLNQSKRLPRVAMLAAAASGMLLFLLILNLLMVLGSDIISRSNFPVHAMSRIIPIIDVEPFVLVILVIGNMIKTSVHLFGVVIGLAQLVNLDDYKPLVFPVSILFVVLAFWDFESINEYIKWNLEIWPSYVLPIQVIIPLIVLVISYIRKKEKS